jgi:hypothetical protein
VIALNAAGKILTTLALAVQPAIRLLPIFDLGKRQFSLKLVGFDFDRLLCFDETAQLLLVLPRNDLVLSSSDQTDPEEQNERIRDHQPDNAQSRDPRDEV